MKRILLVNPWVCDFKFHDFWVRPYGLMRISTMLKKAGLEVSMIDCLNRHDPAMEKYGVKDRGFGRGDYHSEELEKPAAYRKVPRKYKRYGFPEEVLREKLESTKTPDLILLGSGITYTYEGLMKCHSILREYFPLTRLITGGIYATLCHEHAKKNLMPSAVWKGSINNEFVRAVNSMLGTNIGYMEAQEFSETVPDASFYPLSDFAAVRFTEGCPFSCSYCAAGSFYSSFYQRKKENVIKELGTYAAAGISNIAFYDDALLYKNHYFKSVMAEVKKAGFKLKFHASNGLHAAYIDEETAALLKDNNFIEPKISLETSDSSAQKATGGKVTNEIFEKAVKNLLGAGYKSHEISVFILNGLPGQTEESVMKDVSYVKKLGLRIRHSVYSPIPGTADFMKLRPDIRAELMAEPLKQNEYYFLAINPEYGWQANLRVKAEIDRHNCGLPPVFESGV